MYMSELGNEPRFPHLKSSSSSSFFLKWIGNCPASVRRRSISLTHTHGVLVVWINTGGCTDAVNGKAELLSRLNEVETLL